MVSNRCCSCSPRTSKMTSLSRFKASSTTSGSKRLNDARTYAVLLPSGMKDVPGSARTPFLNALLRIMVSESLAPSLSFKRNLFSVRVVRNYALTKNAKGCKFYQKNMPASGGEHSTRPLRFLFKDSQNISRRFR